MGAFAPHVFRLGFGLALVACGGGGGFPDARGIDSPPPAGTFTIDWALTDANNQNLTCDRIGAQGVTVLVHNRLFDGGSTQVFACGTGMGTSQAILPGIYDFDFELDASSGVLATAPGQHGITITAGQNTRLTPLAFSVDATGGLALTLSTGKTNGNCAPITMGGGIATTSITLTRNGDGACTAVTFTVGAGATSGNPAGSYMLNCTTPADYPACIDTDQTLTATGVAADSYTIHVRGKNLATTSCWSNNDSLMVPPLGTTLTRQLNLSPATGTPGC